VALPNRIFKSSFWGSIAAGLSHCADIIADESRATLFLPYLMRSLLFYYLFLVKRKGIYGRIFLTDVRDVIFQEDPFRYASGQALYVFLEIHNHLLWEQRLHKVVICQNGENAAMTLKAAVIQPECLDASERLLNPDGIPAPVLYQYDVHAIFNRFTGCHLY
jgi:hypothetical protein